MKLVDRFLLVLLTITCGLLCGARAELETLQVKFRHVASVTQPVQVSNAGDGSGRLFIVSHQGRILIHKSSELLPGAFLDIADRVATGNERGLFSMAFPPGYASKQYFYVCYARKTDNAVVLSRFTVPQETPDSADSATEQVLLTVPLRVFA